MATKKKQRSSAVVRLSSLNVKGMAHPLRVRILAALRTGGAATASALAAELGESSGSTSYHLRQLERHGFVKEVESRGTKRERWWAAVAMSTSFDEASLAASTEEGEMGREFLRAVAASAYGRMNEWIDGLPAEGAAWAKAGTISDWGLRLKPSQAKALTAGIRRLIEALPAYAPEEEGEAPGQFVCVQLQVLPRRKG